MFRSLTSFIFGTNSIEIDKKDQPVEEQKQQQQQQHHEQQQRRPLKNSKKKSGKPLELLVDAEEPFIITPCTSSVIGKRETAVVSKNCTNRRGKNKGNRSNQRKGNEKTFPTLSSTQQPQQQPQSQPKQQPDQKNQELSSKATEILTSSNNLDEDFEEEDWCIVEREDEQNDLPFIDLDEKPSEPSEVKSPPADEETASWTAVRAKNEATFSKVGGAAAAVQRRRLQLSGTHSLYSGPRPQQQRNSLQRLRSGRPLNLSVSSSARSETTSRAGGSGNNGGCVEGSRSVSLEPPAPADCFGDERVENGAGVTQSLYTISPAGISANGQRQGDGSNGMEESWFVTPPPCFTSIGPIHMETSPYEDLLIEHPSIRSAQEESFVKVDRGLKDNQKQSEVRGKKKMGRQVRKKLLPQEQPQKSEAVGDEKVEASNIQKTAVMPRRAGAARMDHYSATQLKQELFMRSYQKVCVSTSQSFEKKERSHMLCRTAIKRANKVREYQSKANCQRRADLQHFRVVSGVNNNRKCCF